MLLEDVKNEFIFNCQCRKLSEKTCKNYGKQIGYLILFLKDKYDIVHIENVKSQHIKEFLMEIRKAGRTVNYFNDLLKVYKVYFRYAFEENYTKSLATDKIKNAKSDKIILRTFSEDETKRMLNYYNGYDYISIRNKVIIMMLVDTGIRLSELTSLTEEQLKYDYIIIKGKGSKERVVPKSPLLSKWIIKYLAVRKSYFTYKAIPENIFLSKNGKPLDSAIMDRIVKECGDNCNISKDVRISCHTFRHTFAQYQLRHGLDIYSLSRLLGHENISITQTYLNGIRDTEILQQSKKTSPLMNL